MSVVKRQMKILLERFGYDLVRSRRSPPPGSPMRETGQMNALLEDLSFRRFCPSSVIDVGANRGEWSALASKSFPGATFFLIEPQVEMEADLQAFCASHPGSKSLLAGAGSAPGELTLTIWQDMVGSSFLPVAGGEDSIGGRGQRRVPVVTLDSLASSGALTLPQLIKMDVQGFEMEVLKGAREILASCEVVIAETSLYRFENGQPLAHEIIAFMADCDFFIYDFAGFLRRPLDGALGQMDICFVNKQSPLRASQRWA